MKKILNFIANFINLNAYRKKKTFSDLLIYYLIKGIYRFLLKNQITVKIIQKLYKKYCDWPKLIMLHPGIKCNLECLYCYDMENRRKKQDILNLDDYIRIIEQAAELGISQVQILGGEPLLYPDLKNLINACIKYNLDIVVYTNATLLNKDWIIYFLSLKKKISLLVSCDPEQTYTETCGKNMYKTAKTNIDNAIAAGLNVRYFLTVTNLNFNYIRKHSLNISEKTGIAPVFERFLPIKNPKIDAFMKLNKNQWNYIIKLADFLQKKYNVLPIGNIIAIIRGTGCNDFYESIHIGPEGDVSPCDYLLGKYSICNIKDNSLKNCWEIYKSKRDEWNKLPEQCKNCKNAIQCNGGCKSWTYLNTGLFDSKDSLCNNKRPPMIY